MSSILAGGGDGLRQPGGSAVAAAEPVSGGPAVQLPTAFGVFTARAWTDTSTAVEHLSITSPVPAAAAPLVRLHSECLTGDVFGSYRCDCGEQLDQALALIAEQGGTVLYLRGQEGRGIGLANKIRAYALQEAGADTVEANEQLGLPVDARDYRAAAAILHAMGLDTIRLLSNNPAKRSTLAGLGITVTEMVSSEVPSREHNRRYLQTKRDRMDHRLSLLEDNPVRQS
jgi:GTP cyclohydrolase II